MYSLPFFLFFSFFVPCFVFAKPGVLMHLGYGDLALGFSRASEYTFFPPFFLPFLSRFVSDSRPFWEVVRDMYAMYLGESSPSV